MATSLKKYISNPIILAIVVTIIDIVSYIGIGQSNIVKQIEQDAYLQSESFISTLAELTYYLGQNKLGDKGEKDERYENLKDLQYYIEGEGVSAYNDVKLKGTGGYYLKSGINFYSQLESLKTNSDFYMCITLSGDTITGIESFINDASKITRFKSRYITLVNHSENTYESVEAKFYFFIPKGQNLENDYLASQVMAYNEEIQKFLYLTTQLVAILMYLFLVIITIPLLEDDDWVARNINKIPIELKGIFYIGFYRIIQEVKWFIEDISQGNIQSNMLRDNWILTVGYSILVIGLLTIIGYGIRDLIGYYKDGLIKSIKENSILYKEKILQKLLKLVDGDLRYPVMVKLFLLNVGHLMVLSAFVFIASQDFLDAIRWGIIWIILASGFAFALNKDWQEVIEQVKAISFGEKEKKHLLALEKYQSCIGLGLFAYLVVFLIVISLSSEESLLGLILAISFAIGVAWLSLKMTKDLRNIYFYITHILEAKEQTESNITLLSPIVTALSEVKDSFNEAVQKEVISQRMKTELISNVSHDLKTPLTSIISYIDLLKRKDLSEEERNKYIEILDKQSHRLNILIEDLFEASKAASGNIEFVTEEIDLVALLKQTLGEMGEKIERSNLQFKVMISEEEIMCKLDGRRTYRIFGNLITNILKYAAPYSRVYIGCTLEGQETIITFKNISANEMNFTAEEIIERFKRGDESRHTEGSGLGLAIAKNLTELQGGQFDIYIDGDLFKVTLKFDRMMVENE